MKSTKPPFGLVGDVSEEAQKAFWARVSIGYPDQCWLWKGSLNKGYGQCHVEQQWWIAHRMAYFLGHGGHPREFKVLHECDNPPCCNPRHLFLGTDKTNAEDRVAKGRSSPTKVRVEPAVILKIEEELTAGYNSKLGIARRLNVDPKTVRLVARKLGLKSGKTPV